MILLSNVLYHREFILSMSCNKKAFDNHLIESFSIFNFCKSSITVLYPPKQKPRAFLFNRRLSRAAFFYLLPSICFFAFFALRIIRMTQTAVISGKITAMSIPAFIPI